MQSPDQIVIDAFTLAPNWAILLTTPKNMECRPFKGLSVNYQDTLTLSQVAATQVSKTANSLTASTKKRGAGPVTTQPVYEKRLTKDDFAEVIRFAHRSDENLPGLVYSRLVDQNGNPTNDRNSYDHVDIYIQAPGKPEKIIRQLIKAQ